jgi:hypothetical protein
MFKFCAKIVCFYRFHINCVRTVKVCESWVEMITRWTYPLKIWLVLEGKQAVE